MKRLSVRAFALVLPLFAWTPSAAAQSSDFVQTPEGVFPARCVHHVPNHGRVGADMNVYDADGGLVEAVTQDPTCPSAQVVSPQSSGAPSSQSTQPLDSCGCGANQACICNTCEFHFWPQQCLYSNTNGIAWLDGYTYVPGAYPNQSNNETDTVYLWSGLEGSDGSGNLYVLQPVLQYGVFGDQGCPKTWTGAYWMQDFYVIGNYIYVGDNLQVQPGDEIYWSTTAASYDNTFEAQFTDETGDFGWWISVQLPNAPTFALPAISETYNMNSCYDLPQYSVGAGWGQLYTFNNEIWAGSYDNWISVENVPSQPGASCTDQSAFIGLGLPSCNYSEWFTTESNPYYFDATLFWYP